VARSHATRGGVVSSRGIHGSNLSFIRTLLEIGANANPEQHAGFPPLIAALSCRRSRPGSPARADVADILELLLSFGADPNQRGINDYTPLHMAVAEGNLRALQILLDAEADPGLRTRIDQCETPREMVERSRLRSVAELFAEHEARSNRRPERSRRWFAPPFGTSKRQAPRWLREASEAPESDHLGVGSDCLGGDGRRVGTLPNCPLEHLPPQGTSWPVAETKRAR